MTQLALDITNLNVADSAVAPRLVYDSSKKQALVSAPSQSIVVLGAILISLQILDGILTALGISILGTEAEGNAILRLLMEQFGYVSVLVGVKSFAILVICGLCAVASSIAWVKHALRCIICIYTVAAILPWLLILNNTIAF